jgi:hypothetical protein
LHGVWQFVSHKGFPHLKDSFSGHPRSEIVSIEHFIYILSFNTWAACWLDAGSITQVSHETWTAEAVFGASFIARSSHRILTSWLTCTTTEVDLIGFTQFTVEHAAV